MNGSQLSVSCEAQPDAAKRLRHALAAFLDVLQARRDTTEDILIATGEALANAIEHAYEGDDRGVITLKARFVDDTNLAIEVTDHGKYIERDERPGRSFGLRIINSIAHSVEIEKNDGTRINMIFEL